MEQSSNLAVPIILKCGKTVISGLQLRPGSSSNAFKEEVRARTGVPVERQKLMCKGAWPAALKCGVVISDSLSLPKGQSEMTVTLLGTSEALPDRPAEETKFVEDLSAEALAAQSAAADAAAMVDAEGMIVALQKRFGEDRDDKKQELYKYNAMVTGLPQRQIEDMLRRRRESEDGHALLGECAMTLGLELGRAYVNVVTVLHDGTLVNGLDDGKVQLWRHGARIRETYHEMPEALQMARMGDTADGVVCITPLPASSSHDVAFATGGNGCVKLWTSTGECVQTILAPMGVSPSNLESLDGASDISCLVASYRRLRQPDPNAFRLVPQNDLERQRRAQAEAAEAAFQQRMSQLCRSVQLWLPSTGGSEAGGLELKSMLLDTADESMARLTALAAMRSDESAPCMVCGDADGCLHVWRRPAEGSDNPLAKSGLLQLLPQGVAGSAGHTVASVVSMAPLAGDCRHVVAVSTEAIMATGDRTLRERSVALQVPAAQAVFLVDVTKCAVLAVLTAHKDIVRCMSALPDGLATGGGKHDATVRIWQPSRWQDAATDGENAGPVILSDAPKMKEPGYVFALTVLSDTKPGSPLFALAAARYNVVKIFL